MDGPSPQTTDRRSSFVTIVAWVFIAIAGFSTFAAIGENLLFRALANHGAVLPDFRGLSQHLPPMAALMFENIRWLLLALLVASVVTLTAAIGLLLRKNWARRLFIAVLVVSIVWNIANLVFQQLYTADVPGLSQMPADVPEQIRTGLQIFQTVMTVVSVVLTLAIAVLLGWVIKRLMSPSIRAEFS